VLGLARGERERGEQEEEPRDRHEPAVTAGEAVEPIHRRLHRRPFSSVWPASQDVCRRIVTPVTHVYA
jgi:hypothetical protein